MFIEVFIHYKWWVNRSTWEIVIILHVIMKRHAPEQKSQESWCNNRLALWAIQFLKAYVDEILTYCRPPIIIFFMPQSVLLYETSPDHICKVAANHNHNLPLTRSQKSKAKYGRGLSQTESIENFDFKNRRLL